MRCPKCESNCDRRFCPQCGLDLQIYEEIASIRKEIAALQTLAAPRSESGPEMAAPPALPKSQQPAAENAPPKLPPPIPPALPPVQTESSGSAESFPELALGQKWLLGIGVLVLIIGIGFFLKYAFDQDWIGPAARISVGFILGVVLLVAANASYRKALRGLDVGIGAVGLGTLYLTTYAAAQVYQLLPDPLALVVIFFTTAIGITLALHWNSQALAALAFLGGYLAPLIFGVGQFDHWLFLGYLLILTIGGRLLAFGKGWRSLNFVGAILTWALLVSFSWQSYRQGWRQETLFFTHFVFLAHSILPFVDAGIRKRSFRSSIFLLALVNGLFCCIYSDYLLKSDKWPSAMVCLGYAIVAAAFGLLLLRPPLSRLLSGWLIGQALVFLLIFFGKILTSYWVPVAWSAELVVLYWVAAKCNDRTLLAGTVLIALIVIGAMINLDWVNLSSWLNPEHRSADYLVSNRDAVARWSGGLSIIFSLLLITWLDRTGRVGVTHPVLNRWYEFLGVASLFGFANQELHRFAIQFMHQGGLAGFSALWCAFAAGLMFVGVWRRRKVYRGAAIGLLFVTLFKVLLFDTAQVSTPYRILSCIILGTVMVAVSFVYYRFSARLTGR
jgi:uncharacterized membrane protein